MPRKASHSNGPHKITLTIPEDLYRIASERAAAPEEERPLPQFLLRIIRKHLIDIPVPPAPSVPPALAPGGSMPDEPYDEYPYPMPTPASTRP